MQGRSVLPLEGLYQCKPNPLERPTMVPKKKRPPANEAGNNDQSNTQNFAHCFLLFSPIDEIGDPHDESIGFEFEGGVN